MLPRAILFCYHFVHSIWDKRKHRLRIPWINLTRLCTHHILRSTTAHHIRSTIKYLQPTLFPQSHRQLIKIAKGFLSPTASKNPKRREQKSSPNAMLERRNSNNFRNKNKSDVIKLTSQDTPYTFSLKRRKREQKGKVWVFCCCASSQTFSARTKRKRKQRDSVAPGVLCGSFAAT